MEDRGRRRTACSVPSFSVPGHFIRAAFIGRNTALEDSGYYLFIYPEDKVILKAIEELNDPTLESSRPVAGIRPDGQTAGDTLSVGVAPEPSDMDPQ